MSTAAAVIAEVEARDQAVYEVVVACLPRGVRTGVRRGQLTAAWAARHPDQPRPSDRAIDKALQRLRAQGRLFYDGRVGWTWQ